MALIEVKDLSYVYGKGTPFEKEALSEVSLAIEEGSIVAIAGATGSGKSTLIKHLNGLLKPTNGSVLFRGEDISRKDLRALRGKVGLVFQYPEHQLFEETVLKDVAFGPTNLGLEDPKEKAKASLLLVGLGKEYWKRSPFSLSGGEKRRVALAGVLSMEPEVLVLDEPAAGLDPGMKEETFRLLLELRKQGKTILFVSHSLDDILDYADRVILMADGRVKADGKPEEVFSSMEEKPETLRVADALRSAGLLKKEKVTSLGDLVEGILSVLKE